MKLLKVSPLLIILLLGFILLTFLSQDSHAFDPISKKIKLKKALAIGSLLATKTMMIPGMMKMMGMADGQAMFDKMGLFGDMFKDKMNILNSLMGSKLNLLGTKGQMVSELINTKMSPENTAMMMGKLNQFMQGWAALKGAGQAKIQTMMALAQQKAQMMQQLSSVFSRIVPAQTDPVDPHDQGKEYAPPGDTHHYKPVPEYGAPLLPPKGHGHANEVGVHGPGWAGEGSNELGTGGPIPHEPPPPHAELEVPGPGHGHGHGHGHHGPIHGPIGHGPEDGHGHGPIYGPIVPGPVPVAPGPHNVQLQQPYYKSHHHQDQIYFNQKGVQVQPHPNPNYLHNNGLQLQGQGQGW